MRNLLSEYGTEIANHRRWLKSFGEDYAGKWEKRLRAAPEAAICEAATRALFKTHGVAGRPNEDLSCGGPDYFCERDGRFFYAEVTSVTRQAITRATELKDALPEAAEDYSYATKKVMWVVKRKTPQCADQNGPRLLVIGTLHAQADVCFDDLAAENLLTGPPGCSALIDTSSGAIVRGPLDMTELSDSLFIRRAGGPEGSIEFARSSISGVLLCAFSIRPPQVYGVLHPNPAVAFDRGLLPDIKFARLADGFLETDEPKVEWI